MLKLAAWDLAEIRVFAKIPSITSVVQIRLGFFTIDTADEHTRAHPATLEWERVFGRKIRILYLRNSGWPLKICRFDLSLGLYKLDFEWQNCLLFRASDQSRWIDDVFFKISVLSWGCLDLHTRLPSMLKCCFCWYHTGPWKCPVQLARLCSPDRALSTLENLDGVLGLPCSEDLLQDLSLGWWVPQGWILLVHISSGNMPDWCTTI